MAKGAKYAQGNSIISKAYKDGVEFIVAQTTDDLQYLKSMNAKALYGGGEGSKGSILITKNASRSHILEEAIHHEQRMQYGDDFFYANRDALEIEAQKRLLKIGTNEGWSKIELKEIENALETWKKALNSSKNKR
jgi:hypothetical protein